MSDEGYPVGTAYHEAGHGVLAWALGLPIGTIKVRDDDASGCTQIGDAADLPLVEQIAVRYGGIAAEDVFGHPQHRLAGSSDRKHVMDLLRANGTSEENGDGRGLRDQGYERACALLEKHRIKVVAVAEQLVKRGRIEDDEVRRLLPPTRKDR